MRVSMNRPKSSLLLSLLLICVSGFAQNPGSAASRPLTPIFIENCLLYPCLVEPLPIAVAGSSGAAAQARTCSLPFERDRQAEASVPYSGLELAQGARTSTTIVGR